MVTGGAAGNGGSRRRQNGRIIPVPHSRNGDIVRREWAGEVVREVRAARGGAVSRGEKCGGRQAAEQEAERQSRGRRGRQHMAETKVPQTVNECNGRI